MRSAYSFADQTGQFRFGDGTFVTRHLAACTYSMVEEAAIPFLGYLPQDMERSDVFSYYHPEDLPYLKQVYQSIMLEQVTMLMTALKVLSSQNFVEILTVPHWLVGFKSDLRGYFRRWPENSRAQKLKLKIFF